MIPRELSEEHYDRIAQKAERATDRMVLGVLVLNAALLAAMELMFLTASIGAIPLPISALVALFTTPWLVRRASELAGSFGASLPLIVWLLVVGVLGTAGPGGDVLLIGDWRSLLLLGAGLLPAAFRLGRIIRVNKEAGAREARERNRVSDG